MKKPPIRYSFKLTQNIQEEVLPQYISFTHAKITKMVWLTTPAEETVHITIDSLNTHYDCIYSGSSDSVNPVTTEYFFFMPSPSVNSVEHYNNEDIGSFHWSGGTRSEKKFTFRTLINGDYSTFSTNPLLIEMEFEDRRKE